MHWSKPLLASFLFGKACLCSLVSRLVPHSHSLACEDMRILSSLAIFEQMRPICRTNNHEWQLCITSLEFCDNVNVMTRAAASIYTDSATNATATRQLLKLLQLHPHTKARVWLARNFELVVAVKLESDLVPQFKLHLESRVGVDLGAAATNHVNHLVMWLALLVHQVGGNNGSGTGDALAAVDKHFVLLFRFLVMARQSRLFLLTLAGIGLVVICVEVGTLFSNGQI